MGGLQYAAFIIPILLLLVFLEYVISRKMKVQVYTLSDTMINVCCGILERLFDFFYVVMMYFVFTWLFNNVALWHIPTNIFTWVLALLAGDFLAYWHHRLSHEINFFWAAHIVHHQSEELNLTTVFRVSAFAVINRSLFFIWMPLVGFDPVVTTQVIVFIGLYQFVTHSRLVGKLGFLEQIFVTPSHHRVHHARNEKYLDTNYGHVFIIWDKMFGTFRVEEEEPEYGITSGFTSGNPYRAHLNYWIDLFRRSRKAMRFSDKLKVFIKPPTWTPNGVPTAPPEYLVDEQGNRVKFRLITPLKLQFYVFVNVILTLGALLALFMIKRSLETESFKEIFMNLNIIALSLIILVSLFSHGVILDRKPGALTLEFVRLAFVALLIPFMLIDLENNWLYIILGLAIMASLAVWLYGMRPLFDQAVRNPQEHHPLSVRSTVI